MSLPKYNEMYNSILNCLKDGREHSSREIRAFVAKEMNIPKAEQEKLTASGQTIYLARISWACTYLKKAKLISNTTRAVYVLLEEGRKTIEKNINITDKYLMSLDIDSFKEFKSPKISHNTINEESNPPIENLENSYKEINNRLMEDILEEVIKQEPRFFEELVVKLLLKMGYGGTIEDAGSTTKYTQDEGIDGTIKEDKLGFSLIHFQAKKWDTDKNIGRPEIQKFVGAITGKSSKGLFISTANFTNEAIKYAEERHVILINGKKLAELMIEYNLGVSVETVYEIKTIDSDFFSN